MDTKYHLIYRELLQYINSSELNERKLPPERALASHYGVSRRTIRTSLDLLEKEGYISRIRGSGIYISEKYFSRRNKIALLLPDAENYTGPERIAELKNALSAYGYSLAVYETHGHFSEERTILKELLSEHIRGVITIPFGSVLPTPNRDLYEALKNRRVQILFYQSAYRNMTDHPCVSRDDRSITFDLTRDHLSAHPDLTAFGIFFSDDQSSLDRYCGFCEALTSLNLPYSDGNVLFLSSTDQNPDAIASFLNKIPSSREDGIYICHNDEIANRVHDLRRSYHDIIQSFDDSYLRRLSNYAFASYAPDKEQLAVRAARLIHSDILAATLPEFS